MKGRTLAFLGLCAVLGCNSAVDDADGLSGGKMGGTGGTNEDSDGVATSSGHADGSEGPGTAGDDPKFDLGGGPESGGDGGGPGEVTCKVVDDMDAVSGCLDQAPADSFTPNVEWTWTAPGYRQSIVTPLVANFTDDNADGEVDLCDIPDVLLVANEDTISSDTARILLLDGAGGGLHFEFDEDVAKWATPAIGDIDGDGAVEVVTVGPGDGYDLLAFESDGSLAWRRQVQWDRPAFEYAGGTLHGPPLASQAAVALADVDNDGQPEIGLGNMLFDAQGHELVRIPPEDLLVSSSALVFADLDDDDDMELLVGPAAFHHDGTRMWRHSEVSWAFPQVADFDADGRPEVLLTHGEGVTLLEHDGTPIFTASQPLPSSNSYMRPAAVHDFDGDGDVEAAIGAGSQYGVVDHAGMMVWSAAVQDGSGFATGTAFDFLGDASAEAMYGDETQLHIYDAQGGLELQAPRLSRTIIEYPIVVDVDNDQSAETLVVSNKWPDEVAEFTLQVIGDADDRWVPARRIWNQHTYHVTNVREDGTIPAREQPNWKTLNTFRTQAQIGNGGICKPRPVG